MLDLEKKWDRYVTEMLIQDPDFLQTNENNNMTKSGYIYILENPARPDLFKIGVTTRTPEERLKEHNSRFDQPAGQIVKETGQKWEIVDYYEVTDIIYAEAKFWQSTGITDIPYRYGLEIFPMRFEDVLSGIAEAIRPREKPLTMPSSTLQPKKKASRTKEWADEQLKSTQLRMIGKYRGRFTDVEFVCKNAHIFKVIPEFIFNDYWICPVCDLENKDKHEMTEYICRCLQTLDVNYLRKIIDLADD